MKRTTQPCSAYTFCNRCRLADVKKNVNGQQWMCGDGDAWLCGPSVGSSLQDGGVWCLSRAGPWHSGWGRPRWVAWGDESRVKGPGGGSRRRAGWDPGSLWTRPAVHWLLGNARRLPARPGDRRRAGRWCRREYTWSCPLLHNTLVTSFTERTLIGCCFF